MFLLSSNQGTGIFTILENVYSLIFLVILSPTIVRIDELIKFRKNPIAAMIVKIRAAKFASYRPFAGFVFKVKRAFNIFEKKMTNDG